jgi:hypothetical protein
VRMASTDSVDGRFEARVKQGSEDEDASSEEAQWNAAACVALAASPGTASAHSPRVNFDATRRSGRVALAR